jgi:putative ABC transport system ATP-binding protein
MSKMNPGEPSSMSETATPLIELRNVCRHFVSTNVQTRALDDVSLTIDEGDYLAISGPSGCGKSTLLSILGLLDPPSSGTYLLNKHQVEGFDAYQRAILRNKEIGFVFQAFNLIGDLTVFQNVELPLKYARVPKERRREIVMANLAKVAMDHRAHHYPAQLSGGQQQRVAVARGIVTKPSILLADEPTGNLDTATEREIMELLAELHTRGHAIVVVTHEPAIAAMAPRAIRLADGRLVADGPGREIAAAMREEAGSHAD